MNIDEILLYLLYHFSVHRGKSAVALMVSSIPFLIDLR